MAERGGFWFRNLLPRSTATSFLGIDCGVEFYGLVQIIHDFNFLGDWLMSPPLTEAQLIRKMARAEMALENARVNHKDNCIVELDPEGYAPCNCGATATNSRIESALIGIEDRIASADRESRET